MLSHLQLDHLMIRCVCIYMDKPCSHLQLLKLLPYLAHHKDLHSYSCPGSHTEGNEQEGRSTPREHGCLVPEAEREETQLE